MQTIELTRGHKHRGIYRKAGEQLTVTETVARRLVMRGKAKPADGASAKGASTEGAPAKKSAGKKAPKKSAAKKAAAKKATPASNTES